VVVRKCLSDLSRKLYSIFPKSWSPSQGRIAESIFHEVSLTTFHAPCSVSLPIERHPAAERSPYEVSSEEVNSNISKDFRLFVSTSPNYAKERHACSSPHILPLIACGDLALTQPQYNHSAFVLHIIKDADFEERSIPQSKTPGISDSDRHLRLELALL
jgi:hypothetical protein